MTILTTLFMNSGKKFTGLCVAMLLIFLIVGCGRLDEAADSGNAFTILASSELKTLEPIVQQFAKDHNVVIRMQYQGSVDTMRALEQGAPGYDAVWTADGMWISLGDKNRLVKYNKSIMTSPVVFGIRRNLAEQLGFVGKKVSVSDILQAIENKKLTFAMTSASQSNSGASAYIGFLYALAGHPETLKVDDLVKPQVQDGIRKLLAGINRSSGSSEWLKDLFLQGNYDAMVNYEAVIIDTNKALIQAGREPLYVVYPEDGCMIADYTLGYINRGDQAKEDLFLQLQSYLLSEGVQKQILALGRRTGFGGVLTGADPAVFNPAWGINITKTINPIRLPETNVILQALTMYQTHFRKPSFTVFCLDCSGSMAGKGEKQVKEAIKNLLDPELSQRNLLQLSPQDVIVVLPFNDRLLNEWRATGGDAAGVAKLLQNVQNITPSGSTDIYSPVARGMEIMASEKNIDQYLPAIVLMTDGQSNTGKTYSDVQTIWKQTGKDIPVFSITFGDADVSQLTPLAKLTRGTVFDGTKDLAGAFKKVRGYN